MIRYFCASKERKALFWLIFLGLCLRLIFAGLTGLGIDESYTVSLASHWALSYFDHPGISWWLTGAMIHLTGSVAPFWVRLPFVLLFAGSSFLIWHLGSRLFSEKAGLWAALFLNISPVFGLAAASWVLPDGPLFFFLLAGVDCLVGFLGLTRKAEETGEKGDFWQGLGAGVFFGLAFLSKLTTVLTVGAVFFFLLTDPQARVWLRRWSLWLIALLSFAFLIPVFVWNEQHHWIAFTFQGSRALGLHFHLLKPFIVWGGEALFVAPWLWVPMIICMVLAFKAGPLQRKKRFLAWLGVVPVIFFSLVALWSSHRILYHWADPGYLFLFLLLGEAAARRQAKGFKGARRLFIGGLAFILFGSAFVGSQLAFNWFPALPPALRLHRDPAVQGINWTSLPKALKERGLLTDQTVIAAQTWNVAGKIKYALELAGEKTPVIVLNSNQHEFFIEDPVRAFAGRSVLLIGMPGTGREIYRNYKNHFQTLTFLQPLLIKEDNRPLFYAELLYGTGLKASVPF